MGPQRCLGISNYGHGKVRYDRVQQLNVTRWRFIFTFVKLAKTSRFRVQFFWGRSLDLQRSSFYYTSKAVDDSHLRLAIEEICLKQTRYGYRRITDRLNRRGIDVGEETVRHLMREMNLSVRLLRRKIQTTDSKKGKPLYPNLIKELEIVRPNQVWCSDITFIPLSKGKTAYLAIIIDIFTRSEIALCNSQKAAAT